MLHQCFQLWLQHLTFISSTRGKFRNRMTWHFSPSSPSIAKEKKKNFCVVREHNLLWRCTTTSLPHPPTISSVLQQSAVSAAVKPNGAHAAGDSGGRQHAPPLVPSGGAPSKMTCETLTWTDWIQWNQTASQLRQRSVQSSAEFLCFWQFFKV